MLPIHRLVLGVLFGVATATLVVACSSSSGGGGNPATGDSGTGDAGGSTDSADSQVPWPEAGGTFSGTADPVGMISATITGTPVTLTTSSGIELVARTQPMAATDGTITFSAPAGVSSGSLIAGVNLLTAPAAGTYTPGNSRADIELTFRYPTGIEGVAALTQPDGGSCGTWTLVLSSVTQVGSSPDYVAHGTLTATLALCLPGVTGSGTLSLTF
jgi:hypothetical protein